MIKLKSLIYESEQGKYGLGVVDSLGAVHFKSFSKDYIMTMTHQAAGLPLGRDRFRYNNGKVEWTDRPMRDVKITVTNYLERKGYKVNSNRGYWDDEDYDSPDERYDSISESTTKFVHPEEPEDRTGKFWWMSPQGKFYSVQHQNHVEWARNYLINDVGIAPEVVDKWKTSKSFDSVDSSAYYQLINMGWARIGIYEDYIGDEKQIVIDYDYKRGVILPQQLMKAVKDLGIEKGARWIKRDRDKRVSPID